MVKSFFKMRPHKRSKVSAARISLSSASNFAASHSCNPPLLETCLVEDSSVSLAFYFVFPFLMTSSPHCQDCQPLLLNSTGRERNPRLPSPSSPWYFPFSTCPQCCPTSCPPWNWLPPCLPSLKVFPLQTLNRFLLFCHGSPNSAPKKGRNTKILEFPTNARLD